VPLQGIFADLQVGIGETLPEGIQNLGLIVTGQVGFLLHEDPGYLGVIGLRMLILNRSILGITIASHIVLRSPELRGIHCAPPG
jgi:hypothetical protein